MRKAMRRVVVLAVVVALVCLAGRAAGEGSADAAGVTDNESARGVKGLVVAVAVLAAVLAGRYVRRRWGRRG